MKNNQQSWDNATWDGSRIAQLKRSLQLTAKQRFEALEDFSETSEWLADSHKILSSQTKNKTQYKNN